MALGFAGGVGLRMAVVPFKSAEDALYIITFVVTVASSTHYAPAGGVGGH